MLLIGGELARGCAEMFDVDLRRIDVFKKLIWSETSPC